MKTSGVTSIFKAAGCFGSPGIVKTFPVKQTINPAPAEIRISRIVISKSVGRPNTFGSSLNETGVFAIHTKKASYPNALKMDVTPEGECIGLF